jgi:RNA polymerase sigma-70 factor (ECF subfamily)
LGLSRGLKYRHYFIPKLLYSAISELNDIEKALVFLYLEDKDYSEISETLGITEVNARVKMNRVKGKLKKILNP